MDELIDKQAATTIPVMPKEHRHYQTNNLDDAYEQGWNDLQECIENLPTVQPKRGKWILDRSGAYCCSECMEPCATYVMMRPRDRFCKMCGADMRGGKNGTD